MMLDDELTEEELDRLVVEGTNDEKRAVARHPNASLKTLLYLAKNGFAEEVDQNPMMLLHIEGGSYEVVKILEEVAQKTKRGERLEELASSSWDDVRRGVADNKSTPPATLSLLAKDQKEVVRSGAAKNANTPPATLSLLAKDQDFYVRRAVAWNANTPPDTLSLLAKDEAWNERRGVARNKNTPPDTLSLLAKDQEEDVRCGVARNTSTPPAILSLLVEDESVYVSNAAKETLAKLGKASR